MKMHGAYMTLENFLYTYKEGVVYSQKGDGTSDHWNLEANRRIIIPDYQREYRWEEKQIEEIIKDIKDRKCYLGQIVVAKTSDDPKNYYIVDGQQRCISTIILLTVLIREFWKNEDFINVNNYELHLTDNNKDKIGTPRLAFEANCFKDFQEFISQVYNMDDETLEQGTFSDPKEDLYRQKDRYVIACQKAFADVKRFLELYTTTPDKLDFVKMFIENILKTEISLVIFESENSYESERIFLDLNEKGLRLDNEDILKAYYFQRVDSRNGTEALEVWKNLKTNFFNIKEELELEDTIKIETIVNFALQADLLTKKDGYLYKGFDRNLRYKDGPEKQHICELFIATELHKSMNSIVLFLRDLADLYKNDEHSVFYKNYFEEDDSTTRIVFRELFRYMCKPKLLIVYIVLIKFWKLRNGSDEKLCVEDIVQIVAFYIVCSLCGKRKGKQCFNDEFMGAKTIQEAYKELQNIEHQMLEVAIDEGEVPPANITNAEWLEFLIQMFYNDFSFDAASYQWKINATNQSLIDNYIAQKEQFSKDHFVLQNGNSINLYNGDIYRTSKKIKNLKRRVYNFMYHKDVFGNKDFISRIDEIKKDDSDYGEYEKEYISFIIDNLCDYFEVDKHSAPDIKWDQIKTKYGSVMPNKFEEIIGVVLVDNLQAWNRHICEKIKSQIELHE